MISDAKVGLEGSHPRPPKTMISLFFNICFVSTALLLITSPFLLCKSLRIQIGLMLNSSSCCSNLQ